MAVLGKAEITISDILDGKNGKGIKSTAITYQASTSGTTAPTGTWSSTVPSVPQGQYLWSRTVITYTDNTTSTTYSVAYIPKNGATGSTGATGTGVENITQQYYLSTSKTTQIGGSWVTSMPTWSSGKYLWTRYLITYKNPTSTTYTSPVCDSSWEAVNEVQVGGRNLLNGSRDFTIDFNSFGRPLDDTITYNGLRSFKTNRAWDGPIFTISKVAKRNELKAGDTCTLQAMVMANFNDLGPFDFTLYRATEKPIIIPKFDMEPNQWYKITATFELDSSSIIDGALKNTRFESNNFDKNIVDEDGKLLYSFGENKYLWIAGYKLEKGNKATDWTPAPEDVQNDLDDLGNALQQSITDQKTNIISNCENIILEALTEYTKSKDFNTFKETTSSQLKLLSDQMTLNFKQTTQEMSDINKDLQDKFNTITKYFKFDINGLTIGQSESPYKVIIDNDRYSMTVNDVEVMWIANGKVYTPEMEVTKAFKLFGYTIDQDENGNVNMEYTGGK